MVSASMLSIELDREVAAKAQYEVVRFARIVGGGVFMGLSPNIGLHVVSQSFRRECACKPWAWRRKQKGDI